MADSEVLVATSSRARVAWADREATAVMEVTTLTRHMASMVRAAAGDISTASTRSCRS